MKGKLHPRKDNVKHMTQHMTQPTLPGELDGALVGKLMAWFEDEFLDAPVQNLADGQIAFR